MKKINWQNKKLWLIFLAFLIITFFGVYHHEPWSDEAQAWLIARDLPFGEIIKQMPYEGTPALWHSLLFSLNKLGLPYESQAWLHWLIINLAIFIFIFYSPLSTKIKSLFVFSYYPLFEYAVIARNYAPAILILFTIIANHNKRFKYPLLYALLITLLFQTNLLIFAPAFLLSILFISDLFQSFNKKTEIHGNQNRYLASVILMLMGMITAFFQLIPYPGQMHSTLYSPRFSVIAHSFAGIFLPINGGQGEVFFSNPLSYFLSALTLIIIIFLPYFLIKNKKVLIGLYLSWLWLIFLILIKPIGALRHYGFFIIFLITASWLDRYYNSLKSWLNDKYIVRKKDFQNKITWFIFSVLLLPGLIISVINYIKEYRFNFCGGKEMAQYLKENQLEKTNIASLTSPINMSLLPYLPETKFWQVEREVFGTYTTYDSKFIIGQLNYEQVKNKIINNFVDEEFFLLSVFKLDNIDKDWVLVAENKTPTFSGGYYYLYKLANN